MRGASHIGPIGRTLRRALGALSAACLVLMAAVPAQAHGGVTGTQDVVQDYGILLFLLATVLIGAGVLAWAAFSPSRDELEDDEETDATEGRPPGGAESAGAGEAPAGAVTHGRPHNV